MIRRMRKKHITPLPLLLLMLVLAACGRPTPIPIFVTPTPSGPTAVPTIAPLPTETPTLTVTPQPTTPTPAPPTIIPTTGVFGPIIPPDYTLPPTFTPRPTDTPTPGPPTVTPIPLPTLDNSRIGIQIHSRLTDDEWWQMLQRARLHLNVDWIKVQFPWDEMEPDGPGSETEYNRRLERFMQMADGQGLQVLASITKAPEWARPTDQENGPPNDPQTYANFIQGLLNRFGNSIDAIEVWNEPNLRREWNGGTMNGAEYMRLFRPAYETITAWSQQTGHRIQIITAGLAPTIDTEFSADDRAFMREMLAAGLGNYPDVAVGIHPYGWGNAADARCCNPVEGRGWDENERFFFLDNIDAYRQIIVNAGSPTMRMWITEFGWATYDGFNAPPPDGDDFFTYVTEGLQATYTLQAFDIVQNSGAYDFIDVMILWNLNFGTIPDAVSVHRDERAGYSLMRPDGSYRPLYEQLRDILGE